MMKDGPQSRGGRAGSARGVDFDVLSLEVLTFLAADEEALQRFMAATGADLADVRQLASDPGFQRGLLSYLAADEDLLVRFATAQGLKPDDLARTLMSLDTEERSYDIRSR